jgi:flagellar biosynthesis/type III secretory pathway protein FliH
VIDRTDLEFEVPGINLIFLELAKRKNLGNFSIDNPVDRWLTFLAEPEKILAMTKFDLSVYPNLMKAAELLDESNFTQAQLDAYDRHLMAVYDINRSRIESFDKGFEEGVGIGEERGVEKGREEGMDLSVIIIKELQKRELSHEEIATKHGVELQVVIKLAAALK